MIKIHIVQGLGYGDECKGAEVDFLTRTTGARLNVRFGGPQAIHNVITPGGRHHAFNQFGSGSFVDGVRTHLSQIMPVNPLNLMREAEGLEKHGVPDPMSRLTIDERCLMVTPIHVTNNRMRELARGQSRHGSVGKGVGEAVAWAEEYPENTLHISDLNDTRLLRSKLYWFWVRMSDQAREIACQHSDNPEIQQLYEELKSIAGLQGLTQSYNQFADEYSDCIVGSDHLSTLIRGESDPIIFEGSQGALLDPNIGFWPHVTKVPVTATAALELIGDTVDRSEIEVVGVTRAYTTRHGAGPFVTESGRLTELLPPINNTDNMFQEHLRVGCLDRVALRYAIEMSGGVDMISLTCADKIAELGQFQMCTDYEYCGQAPTTELQHFFFHEPYSNSRSLIRQIKHTGWCDRRELKKLGRYLAACQPLHVMDLPSEPRMIAQFLSTSSGLNVPVRRLATGPTWKDRTNL